MSGVMDVGEVMRVKGMVRNYKGYVLRKKTI